MGSQISLGRSKIENAKGEVMLRRLRTPLLTIVAVVAIVNVVCFAQSTPLWTHHVREVTVSGQARLIGRLPATQSMRLVLALPLRNQDGLNDFLQDVYNPSSPSYHHFLTVEEFTRRFGPSQKDYDAVIRFAEENGLRIVGKSRNRVNVDVDGPVSRIEQTFHVTMNVYQHPTENRTFYAPDREPTPNLSVRLWHISGLDNYSIPRPAIVRRGSRVKSKATTGSGPGASFLGSDMRAAYYGGTLTGSGQSLGLFEFYGTDLADLNTYYSNVGQTNNVPITLLSVDGTSTSCLYSQGCDDTEQTLDMTQALGMAPGMSSLVMYVGSTDSAIFNAMATASPLNAQLSCSWGWSPTDASTDDPYFEELAAQGQNLFVAAGDSGAWSSSSQDVYPADDVYITSVGGTDLTTSSAGGPWASETAWADGGGGISPNDFAIPSWQTATANGCSSCSKTYRNAPDVSANANFTFYVCADQTTCTENYYGGTSFAAPMWAGYLALVNQQAIANGKSALGFINPSLYTIGLSSSYGTDFHDITSGSNGYSAATGYDLATGWGSPNGSGLITSLAGGSTQNPSFTLSASPSALTVTQGNNGTSTITVTSQNSFNSAVTLSASGLPSGVTATFGTNPVTPPADGTATSVLTLSASATAATGTATVTVTGTSGSLNATTTIALTVNSSSGAQTAVYNSTLKAPWCSTVATSCDSGPTLLLGRDHISGGAEPNQPNTINSSCADGTAGTFHSDESNDRIVVSSTSGGPLTHATKATVTATVWAWSGYTSDHLDLYYAANANSPSWVFIGTINPTKAGAQSLSATFTLPTGSLQAVRAQFRYLGRASSCTSGSYNDHDDLIFAVK
jgi:kumamolisin